MRQRSFLVSIVVIAILMLGAVGSYAYDAAHDHQIARGVQAGGIAIGGMSTSAAKAKLSRELTPVVQRGVTVVFRDRRFDLDAQRAQTRLDVDGMVRDALDRSRGGNVVTRTLRGILGGHVRANVPASVTFSHSEVDSFVHQVAQSVDLAPQDANIGISGGSLRKVEARDGRRVDEDRLRQRVETALAKVNASREVAVPYTALHPRVTTAQLAARYPTVIEVNRGAFQLTLYKRLKVARTYTIAVGRQGLETPAGRYVVHDKEVDPAWHVPNSSWAGNLAGQVIPPGPQDPLKARWIGITDGAGIHGTDDLGSLGTAASHGCIRMAIPDVIDLYDRTPYGSVIYVI
ncbi:MAG: L,D-transpeptidase/peptidoglycan binding protein [Actinobacteria bacterium]|nr:L,D-transpeptidase/peptidoglycan binding protein [Actinomycetota bacterium]